MNDNKIKLLPKELIDQIAAGEVVERPASVVKELVENSLDAGAKNISIEIENGGINLVKITDDGCGMSSTDALLSVAQHATSKIGNVADLFQIQTLGFRGEALASISSVSDFTLETRRAEDLSGTQIKIHDHQTENSAIGCPVGTSIAVRDLFYNIPVRKKYLKTAVTEFNNIVDLFLNYVLSYPEISFKLSHNGKMVYQYSSVTEWQDRLYEVLGAEISNFLIPVEFNSLELKVTGFIGRPQLARNNRRLQYLFVNKRPVNEFVIAKRIKDAYETLIPNNMFPVFLLHLHVEPSRVDVNVHPRKLEVRFSDPQKIYQLVYRCVSDALDKNELVKSILTPTFYSAPSVPESRPSTPGFSFQPSSNINSQPSMNYGNRPANNWLPSTESASFIRENQENRDYRIIGQVHNSYIIVEAATGLRIYDQHAVSERVQYEKIKNDWLAGGIAKQQLLIPRTMSFSPGEASLLQTQLEKLVQFGFEITPFGQNDFAVNAVPQILAKKDYEAAIRELVSTLESNDNENEGPEIDGAVNRVLNMMSCRSAVKFGDVLSFLEMTVLLDNLAKCDNRYTCVHGRPCVLEYPHAELEKLFKRRT